MQRLTLLANRPIAEGLFELAFEKPADWSFKAGQFARLGLETDGGDPVFRAYSIASAPEADELRFLVKCVTDGALSPRLTSMKPGEAAILEGPADGNLLPSRVPGGDTLWLMATGSGLAPFLAMTESESAVADWQEVVIVIGARTRNEADGLKALAERRARRPVTVLTATTREDSALTGRLPDLLSAGELEKAAQRPIDADSARVLMCGNPGFTKSLRALLKTRDMVSPRFGKPGQVLVEALW